MKEKNLFTIMKTGQVNDWLGISINPFSEHIEGKYTEALYRSKVMKELANMLIMYLQELENRIIFLLQRRM